MLLSCFFYSDMRDLATLFPPLPPITTTFAQNEGRHANYSQCHLRVSSMLRSSATCALPYSLGILELRRNCSSVTPSSSHLDRRRFHPGHKYIPLLPYILQICNIRILRWQYLKHPMLTSDVKGIAFESVLATSLSADDRVVPQTRR